MNKHTLNIAAVCVFLLIIVFSITQKDKLIDKFSDNIVVDENGKIVTKADRYQENILATVTEENIKNFQKFSKSFQKNSSDNLTDSLSKDVFTQYIKYNTSGEIKTDEIAKMTNDLLKNKIQSANTITINQIKTTSSSVENLKIYGTNLAIVQDALTKVISNINTKKDKTPYVAAAYRGAADVLKTVVVPDILAENHLLIVNGYIKYSEGMSLLEYQNSDPARALLGINSLQTATTELTNGFEKIRKTIILNKVSYTADDPGMIWTNNNINNETIKIE